MGSSSTSPVVPIPPVAPTQSWKYAPWRSILPKIVGSGLDEEVFGLRGVKGAWTQRGTARATIFSPFQGRRFRSRRESTAAAGRTLFHSAGSPEAAGVGRDRLTFFLVPSRCIIFAASFELPPLLCLPLLSLFFLSLLLTYPTKFAASDFPRYFPTG